MTAPQLWNLAVLSVTRPADAARTILAMDLPRGTLWTALALAVVLNTLLYGLSGMVMPAPQTVPAMFDIPGLYLVIVGGGLVMSIYAITWVGRLMGGQGGFDQVMALIVWLQFLRVAVQAATLVLALTVPALAVLLVLAAALIGLWLMLHFVDQAHRLGSLGRAAFVLVGAVFAIAIFVYLLMLLLGGAILGLSPHV